jgi:hypothetical protein
MTTEGFIPPYGGHEQLVTYQKALVIFQRMGLQRLSGLPGHQEHRRMMGRMRRVGQMGADDIRLIASHASHAAKRPLR